MQAIYYTDKSIAVLGETKPWASDLRSIGGKFNGNLKGQPGWIFSKTKEPELMQFIAEANAGVRTPSTAAPRAAPAQMVPLGSVPTTMSPQMAMARLQMAQSEIAQPRPGPVLTLVPTAGPMLSAQAASIPASSTFPTLVPAPQIASSIPQIITPTPAPVAALPSQPTTLSYPNLFTAADGLTYQVIICTVPLPFVGQRVTMEEAEKSTEYTVSSVDKASFPFDTITLVDTSEEQQSRATAILKNGVWKVDSVVWAEERFYPQEHRLIFHPPA